MRKKVFLTLLFYFFLFNLAFGFAIFIHIKYSKDNLVNEIYSTRVREFKTYYKGEKIVLNALAEYISHAPCVIEAYLKNDRGKLIKCMYPLYDLKFCIS